MSTTLPPQPDTNFHIVDVNQATSCNNDSTDLRKSPDSGSSEITGEASRSCSVSEWSVDLDSDLKLHLEKLESRDCRICQVSLDLTNHESGTPMELGCSCKNDLAAAHKQCAEAWFKIKGNKTCEICGSTARNVSGANEAEQAEQWNESTESTTNDASAPHVVEARSFWQGHRFLNFLLACMVFAFVISWLFHFNVPS